MVDRDRGYRQLMRNIGRGAAGAVNVGIRDADARQRYPSGATVGDVASWHEAGTQRMQSRPFLTSWWDQNRQRLEREVRAALVANLKKGQLARRLEEIAERSRRGVVKHLARLAPLDPDTVRAKGSSRILVDSGLLVRSISGWVDLQYARLRVGQGIERARGALGRLFGRSGS